MGVGFSAAAPADRTDGVRDVADQRGAGHRHGRVQLGEQHPVHHAGGAAGVPGAQRRALVAQPPRRRVAARCGAAAAGWSRGRGFSRPPESQVLPAHLRALVRRRSQAGAGRSAGGGGVDDHRQGHRRAGSARQGGGRGRARTAGAARAAGSPRRDPARLDVSARPARAAAGRLGRRRLAVPLRISPQDLQHRAARGATGVAGGGGVPPARRGVGTAARGKRAGAAGRQWRRSLGAATLRAW